MSTVFFPTLGVLNNIRPIAPRMLGGTKGPLVTARLAAHRCDPGFDLAHKSVMMWAAAVWDQFVEPEVMNPAWKHVTERVAKAVSERRAERRVPSARH